MTFKIIFLEEFGKAFVPKKVIPNLRIYLLKAGINKVPYKSFGALFYLSALITGIVYLLFIFPFISTKSQLILLIFSFLSWFSIQIFLVTFFILLVYFYLKVKCMQEYLFQKINY